jgi:hypothetical protein
MTCVHVCRFKDTCDGAPHSILHVTSILPYIKNLVGVYPCSFGINRIGRGMVNVFAMSVVDSGIEPRLGKAKEYVDLKTRAMARLILYYM